MSAGGIGEGTRPRSCLSRASMSAFSRFHATRPGSLRSTSRAARLHARASLSVHHAVGDPGGQSSRSQRSTHHRRASASPPFGRRSQSRAAIQSGDGATIVVTSSGCAARRAASCCAAGERSDTSSKANVASCLRASKTIRSPLRSGSSSGRADMRVFSSVLMRPHTTPNQPSSIKSSNVGLPGWAARCGFVCSPNLVDIVLVANTNADQEFQ